MPPTFPPNLGLKVELLLNGTWTDITQYVLQRNPIQITGIGRPDWSSQIQASQCTMTLRNDGRFSPKNSSGAYFPYITRNVQIRVSVNSQSSTGVAYNGFRFWGEVTEWPPRWDPSQRNVYCEIVASGIWRRLSQLDTTLGSAYRRYYVLLTGSSVPQAYWPMEDGSGSSAFVAFAGTSVSNATWVGKPSLASNTGDFKGSDGIVAVNGAIITATVPATGTATNNCTRFLISVPVKGDSGSGTINWNLAEIDSAGTIAKFEVYVNFNGTLGVNLRNSGGTILASGSTTTNVQALPVIASCELTPSGGNVAWAFRIITGGAAGITESLTGTISTASIGRISQVIFNRAGELQDTAVGHLSVTYGTVPSMVTAADAVNGHIGEKAMDRFTRLCAELGITSETIGTASGTAAMGPQLDDTLANVLQAIELTDLGLLFESRGQFGLGYRGYGSMIDQVAVTTLDYSAKIIDPAFAPTYDDQQAKNNITVTNWTGVTQQVILTSGAMSVNNPPSGIGNGYTHTQNTYAASDSQLVGIAASLLKIGTVDEIRFPSLTFQMIKSTLASHYADIPGLRPGDYFQLTNPPAFLTGSTIKQLAWGISETLNARQWTITINAVPESPWESGFSSGTSLSAQVPGGSAAVSIQSGQTDPIIPLGTITANLLSNSLVVAGIVDATTITGAQFVATGTSGEILAYSGTPASGNLVASVSPVSGTDSFGNAYLAGTCSYVADFTAQLNGGMLQFYENKTAGFTPSSASSSSSFAGELVLGSGLAASATDVQATIATYSKLNADTGRQYTSQSEIDITADQIYANGGFSLTNGGGPFVLGETWHNITTSGWTGICRVKLTPWNAVWLDMHLTSNAATSGGAASTFGSLPSAAYYPSATIRFPVVLRGGFLASTGSFPGTPAWTFIQTSGGIQVVIPALTASQVVTLDCSTMYPTN